MGSLVLVSVVVLLWFVAVAVPVEHTHVGSVH